MRFALLLAMPALAGCAEGEAHSLRVLYSCGQRVAQAEGLPLPDWVCAIEGIEAMAPCFARTVERGLASEVTVRLGLDGMEARYLRSEFGLDCAAAAPPGALSCHRRFAARMSCLLQPMVPVIPVINHGPWRSGVQQVDIRPGAPGAAPVVVSRVVIDPHPGDDTTCSRR